MPQQAVSVCYVYLFRHRGRYKIGHSGNPAARLAQVVGRGRGKIVHVFPSANAYQVETALHRRFADKHDDGEWFHLSDSEVGLICQLSQTDTAADLPPDLRPPPGAPHPTLNRSGRRGDPDAPALDSQLTFAVDQDLIESLDQYRKAQPHWCNRAEVLRGCLRAFLEDQGFWPPKDTQ